jgi:hypothetical protein
VTGNVLVEVAAAVAVVMTVVVVATVANAAKGAEVVLVRVGGERVVGIGAVIGVSVASWVVVDGEVPSETGIFTLSGAAAGQGGEVVSCGFRFSSRALSFAFPGSASVSWAWSRVWFRSTAAALPNAEGVDRCWGRGWESLSTFTLPSLINRIISPKADLFPSILLVKYTFGSWPFSALVSVRILLISSEYAVS